MNWNTGIDTQYWVLMLLALVVGYLIHRGTMWFLGSMQKGVEINEGYRPIDDGDSIPELPEGFGGSGEMGPNRIRHGKIIRVNVRLPGNPPRSGSVFWHSGDVFVEFTGDKPEAPPNIEIRE